MLYNSSFIFFFSIFQILFVHSYVIQDQRSVVEYDTCVLSAFQSCSLAYLRFAQSPGKKFWKIVPGGGTICNDGSPYAFQVWPGKTDQAMFWFQGGGACYNWYTCIEKPAGTRSFSLYNQGAFDYKHTNNPFLQNGYTLILNNYCTGDFFSGDETKILHDLATGNTTKVFFKGTSNTLAILKWVENNMRNSNPFSLSNIKLSVVGGDSAGSIGAQLWSQYFINRFNTNKFLLDSFVGIMPVGAGQVLQYLGVCRVGQKYFYFSEKVMNDCISGRMHLLKQIFEPVLRSNSKLNVLYTGSADDAVQRHYYVLTSSTDYSNPKPFEAAQIYIDREFTFLLKNTLGDYSNDTDSFQSYVVSGIEHCFITYPRFYNASLPTYKNSMIEVVSDFLKPIIPITKTTTTTKLPKSYSSKEMFYTFFSEYFYSLLYYRR